MVSVGITIFYRCCTWIFQLKKIWNIPPRPKPQRPPIISLMVYYTPEFKREVFNPLGSIRSSVAATNDALKKSGLGEVKVELHCIEELAVMDHDSDDAIDRLKAFEKAKNGNIKKLLNTADTAMLVTRNGVSVQNVQDIKPLQTYFLALSILMQAVANCYTSYSAKKYLCRGLVQINTKEH